MATFGLVKLRCKNFIFYFFAGNMGHRARIPRNLFAMLRTAVPTMAILLDIIIIINSMQLSTEQQTLSFLLMVLFLHHCRLNK
jgi:hypothetical protein